MTSPLLMDFTDEGSDAAGFMVTDGLVFVVTTVAYGTDGYDSGDPTSVDALVPSATALGAEVYRKAISQTVVEDDGVPRGKEKTYTTLSGDELPSPSALGEAGLFSVVTDPGTAPSPFDVVGYEFMMMQAHFPRQCLADARDRLPIEWWMDFDP